MSDFLPLDLQGRRHACGQWLLASPLMPSGRTSTGPFEPHSLLLRPRYFALVAFVVEGEVEQVLVPVAGLLVRGV